MHLTGMLCGSRLLRHVGFPAPEILGPDATEEQIQRLIDRHGIVFVKPVFRGGIGKNRKAVADVRDGRIPDKACRRRNVR